MPVIVHDTENTATLPNDVVDIIRNFTRPLPQDVAQKLGTIDYAKITHADKDQLIELLQDNEDEDTKRLAGVVHLVLLSSCSIADVVVANLEEAVRPTTPIWFPLLRTVARIAYEDAHAT